MTARSVILVAGAILCAITSIESSAQTRDINVPKSLYVVFKRASAGSNISRARIEERSISPDAMRKLLAAPIESAMAKCAADGRDLRIRLEESSMRDNIGQTNTRLHGVGLYVSLPEAGFEARGSWYIAPYISVSLTLENGATVVESTHISDFAKHEIEKDLLGQMDFLKIETTDLIECQATP